MKDSPSGGQIALVLLLGVLWGLNWPTVKIALAEIGPWTLRASALSIASVALVALSLARGRSLRIRRDHWWRVGVPGVLAIAAPNVLIAYAQLYAPTSRIAVVAFTMPIWATILAWLFLGEPLDRRRLAGLALGIAGLASLAWPLVVAGEISIGLILALIASVCWASGTVLMKRYPSETSALSFATWQVVIGATFVSAGMFVFEGIGMPRALSNPTLIAFAYHALLGQALATAIWFEIVTRIPAGIAALGTLLVPAVGVATAMLFLGERPSTTDFVGLALIIAAMGSVLLRGRRR